MRWIQSFRSLGIALLLLPAAGLGGPVQAESTIHLSFIPHAEFFSTETHQPKPIDPQVFVKDASAPAATGPQGIHHVAGIRPAFIDQDPKNTQLMNADAKPLAFTLGQWLAAQGNVTITPESNGKAKVVAGFSKLRPGGRYSLFENHFDQKPIGFTPLDGAGVHNNFTVARDGTARITLTAPNMPTHANAVLLVYHSDGKDHGKQRGHIGLNAHHQLIARIPE